MNQRVQFYGGFSLDASLTDSNTYFEVRRPLYTKDDLKNLRNITYSVELGTKIKVMKNGYISLGYKYIPKPIEIANPNYIVETTKHQINIGLVYDFK
ncbi:hypothetical protein K4L44_14715 [Halosquirtibacter laminarini]|uniref:Uncharacterized protein n=1 Tax=Halosquirtibacter laminarini TaxID=3374600 RepID=A0AC61NP19_9BACT|nr:hypothetical protein K4L44_14715 [Prolixibacteraceae bacterium]